MRLNTLANFEYGLSRFLTKVAKSSLTWTFKEGEKEFLISCIQHYDFAPLIAKYEESERERRRKIYAKSQIVNDERCRSYNTVEFEDIKRLAEQILKSCKKGREELRLFINTQNLS